MNCIKNQRNILTLTKKFRQEVGIELSILFFAQQLNL